MNLQVRLTESQTSAQQLRHYLFKGMYVTMWVAPLLGCSYSIQRPYKQDQKQDLDLQNYACRLHWEEPQLLSILLGATTERLLYKDC